MSPQAARGASFGSTAEQCERARPGYSPARLAHLFAEIGLDRPRIQLFDRMESHSSLSVSSPEDRRPVLDEVAALVADVADVAEPFDVPYRTEADWCRKLRQQPS